MIVETNKGKFDILRNIVDFDGATPLTHAVCVADKDYFYTFGRNATDNDIINTINEVEG